MSMSSRSRRPSSGNMDIVLRMAKASHTPDDQGGSETLWLEVGFAWAARFGKSSPKESWKEGSDSHERGVNFVIRSAQSFDLPDSTECLDWKIQYNGKWCKLSTIEPHNERPDFMILRVIEDGANFTITELLYDGTHEYDGSRIYQ